MYAELKRIRDSAAFQSLIDAARTDIINEWMLSDDGDVERRERCFMRLRVLDDLLNYLDNLIAQQELRDKLCMTM